jgi:hypothetical protein
MSGWPTIVALMIAGWLVVWLAIAGLLLVPAHRRQRKQQP